MLPLECSVVCGLCLISGFGSSSEFELVIVFQLLAQAVEAVPQLVIPQLLDHDRITTVMTQLQYHNELRGPGAVLLVGLIILISVRAFMCSYADFRPV